MNLLPLVDRAYLYTIRANQMLGGFMQLPTIVTKVYEVCYDSQTAVAQPGVTPDESRPFGSDRIRRP